MKILLVEDNAAQAETLSKLLRKIDHGIEIFSVQTLAEGLAKSVEIKADVTLLDLCLSDSPDWRATAAAIPKFHPPVIVVTDLDDPDVEPECYRQGAQNVFSKKLVNKFVMVLLAAAASAQMRALAKNEATDRESLQKITK